MLGYNEITVNVEGVGGNCEELEELVDGLNATIVEKDGEIQMLQQDVDLLNGNLNMAYAELEQKNEQINSVTTLSITENGVYTPPTDVLGYNEITVVVDIPEIPECPEIPLTSLNVTENGVYTPTDGGYNKVFVNVSDNTSDFKLQFDSIKINNNCIKNGHWDDYDKIDTTYTTSLANMFYNCTKLQITNLTNLDTSNVTNLSQMFYGCNNLCSVDNHETCNRLEINNWNVSKVTNMSYMFYGCSYIKYFKVSNWDVGNVTNMSGMFRKCTMIDNINLNKWKTNSLTNTHSMFRECTSLNTIDISNFNTINVTTMANMFYECDILEYINLSNWNVSNVTDMSYMFYKNRCLKSVGDISNWNVSNVTDMSRMFGNSAYYKQQMDFTKWNVSKVTDITCFSEGTQIEDYVGGRTINEVISGNIGIFNGLKVNGDHILSNYANRASLRALINGVADLTGQSSKKIILSRNNVSKLTDEDIAVATAKNWTIA